MAKATETVTREELLEEAVDQSSPVYKRFRRWDEVRLLMVPMVALLSAIEVDPDEGANLSPDEIRSLLWLAKQRMTEAKNLVEANVEWAWKDFVEAKKAANPDWPAKAAKPKKPKAAKAAKPHWKTLAKQQREAAAEAQSQDAGGGQ